MSALRHRSIIRFGIKIKARERGFGFGEAPAFNLIDAHTLRFRRQVTLSAYWGKILTSSISNDVLRLIIVVLIAQTADLNSLTINNHNKLVWAQ
jgi:hypothetical protein